MTSRLLPTLVLIFASTMARAGEVRQLVRVWEKPSVLETPSAVAFDPEHQALYVSQLGSGDRADPWAREGRGSVAKLSADGVIIDAKWLSGLDSPRGLGVSGGRLYLAVLDRVHVADLSSASVVSSIPVPGARTLAGLAIAPDGVIHVSALREGRIFAIKATLGALKQPGRSFVIIGRRTFSSAIINAMDIRRKLGARFVGEPTSGTANHYGEVQTFTLPSSGAIVSYLTKYFGEPGGPIEPIRPDIPVAMSFADVQRGVDPAVEVVRAAARPPGVDPTPAAPGG